MRVFNLPAGLRLQLDCERLLLLRLLFLTGYETIRTSDYMWKKKPLLKGRTQVSLLLYNEPQTGEWLLIQLRPCCTVWIDCIHTAAFIHSCAELCREKTKMPPTTSQNCLFSLIWSKAQRHSAYKDLIHNSGKILIFERWEKDFNGIFCLNDESMILIMLTVLI